MDWLKSLAGKEYVAVSTRHVEQGLDEELQGYLEAATDHKLRNGMTEVEARRAANVDTAAAIQVKRQISSSCVGNRRWRESSGARCVWSAASLVKSPGFTARTVFSRAGDWRQYCHLTLINQVLLRNLPVRDPQQLVTFGDSVIGGMRAE